MAEVTVNTLVSDDAGVATVKVVVPGFSVERTASSKRHPRDAVLRSVGEGLALARALRAAADDLETQAMERSHYWNG